MKFYPVNSVLFSLGLAAATILGGASLVKADPLQSSELAFSQSSQHFNPGIETDRTTQPQNRESFLLAPSNSLNLTNETLLSLDGALSNPMGEETATLPIPKPGTAQTKAAPLLAAAPVVPGSEPEGQIQTTPSEVAQLDITPGRSTRSGPSYVGVGVNVGAAGDTPLGNTSFTILSKIGLTRTLSVRPAILISGDVTFVIPITYDFPIQPNAIRSFAPFVGVGAAFSTGNDENADFIVTGGIDIPLSDQFTATASANFGVIGGLDIGILLGIGYTFPGF